ncbi:hypothetical protein I553_1868 [Mycobacterium xenopi 4042]|uniref:Uncharacterized protein n=1 Tax=Mycobacterium xenopi 4042 TaxID=1299334 RepID=X8DMG6_MYCXE|nr:hypothetical protein I553_1868 [Mycobacterium xenopi 4042]
MRRDRSARLRRGERADAPVSSLYVTAVFTGQARNVASP